MLYRLLGRIHATGVALQDGATWRERSGQGTVEYVALVLLVAVILAGVVGTTQATGMTEIPEKIVDKLKEAIDHLKIGG